MKVLKWMVILMVLIVLGGCGSKRNTVTRSSPDASSSTTPEIQRTPHFADLNQAVGYLGAELAETFPAERGTSTPSPTVIAVGDFVNAEGRITLLGRVVADKMTPVLVRSKKFVVLERALIERVITEQQFQLSPFSDEASTAEFGKIVGAQTIVTGTINKVGETYYLNARAIDVERGSLLTSADVEVRRTPELDELANSDIPDPNPPETRTRVFRAEGVGFISPKFKNPAQARLMAYRAAKGDAMRNLVEEIKGSQISSDTTIADLMTQNDTIRMQLDTTLRGARVIRRDDKPDGSVAVEMEVELPEDLVQALYGQ
jgi:TolB-like protein